jgi:hypothetical protein
MNHIYLIHIGENFLNHLMKINGRINEKVFLISCLILSSCLSKEPVKEIVVKESKIVEVERITLSKGKFQYFIISGKTSSLNQRNHI